MAQTEHEQSGVEAGHGADAKPPGPPATETSAPWRALRQNLFCGVKGALFLRVAEEDLHATPGALAFLAAADAFCNLTSSLLLSGSAGGPAYASIPSFFFHLPLMLLCALLAARLLSRPPLLLAIPVALIALSIPLELAHYALEGLSRLPALHWLQDHLEAPNYYRFFWWWVAASLLLLVRLMRGALPRRLEGLLLFLLLVAAPLWLFPRGDLWAAPTTGESGELRLTEEVLDAQAHLLDRQLAALAPGVTGESHLYFVGFAGDASQDVFTKEITAAQRLLDRRFGTAGRSVVLANNPRTATTLPFATATNLERAVKGVGRVMNRQDDVLVLFLTSHGSADHVLTVDNGPLELEGVTPEMVRRIVKESGIVWKVLVVSACYSGGFLEPLKDEHTIVITAADATHESFGCGYGEEYTWFGEALLKEGLRNSYSFVTAFDRAHQAVQKWEQEQGETPSNPQIFVGKKMAEKDRQMEKILGTGSRARR